SRVTPFRPEASWTNASYLTDTISARRDVVIAAVSELNRSGSATVTAFALMVAHLVASSFLPSTSPLFSRHRATEYLRPGLSHTRAAARMTRSRNNFLTQYSAVPMTRMGVLDVR